MTGVGYTTAGVSVNRIVKLLSVNSVVKLLLTTTRISVTGPAVQISDRRIRDRRSQIVSVMTSIFVMAGTGEVMSE